MQFYARGMAIRFPIWLVVVATTFAALTVVAPRDATAEVCDQDCALQLRRSGEAMALSQLILASGVGQRGDILDARLCRRADRWTYVFQILDPTAGKVFTAQFDAKTGARLSNTRC